jgi:hypothetical protein
MDVEQEINALHTVGGRQVSCCEEGEQDCPCVCHDIRERAQVARETATQTLVTALTLAEHAIDPWHEGHSDAELFRRCRGLAAAFADYQKKVPPIEMHSEEMALAGRCLTLSPPDDAFTYLFRLARLITRVTDLRPRPRD